MTRQFRQIPRVLRKEDVTLIIDSNEQLPLPLKGYKTKTHGLQTGDYSIEGLEELVTIERKSLHDLIGCVGHGRDRFERELHRMRGFDFAAVVVESYWFDLMEGDWRGKITVAQALGSILGWTANGTNFIFAGSRDHADLIVRGLLWHYAKQTHEKMCWLKDYKKEKDGK